MVRLLNRKLPYDLTKEKYLEKVNILLNKYNIKIDSYEQGYMKYFY